MDEPGQMIRPRLILRVVLLLGLVLGVWLGWPYVRALATRPPIVETAVVERADVERVLAVTGRVRPRQRNDLVPIERGRLVALVREEGDVVQADEVLARLDATRLCADIAEAAARVAEASDGLAQAERDLARAQGLEQAGVASPAELERVRLDLQVRRSALVAAQRREESLTTRREDLLLRSPIDGVVIERPVDPGQTVGPGDVVYVVATLDNPLVEAEIDERFLTDLKVGQSTLVAAAGRSGDLFEARLSHIGQNVNRLSGAVIVRFELAEEGVSLLVGQTLDVNVKIADHPGAIVVPRAAVADLDAKPWVVVAERTERAGERRAVRREVEVIDWPAERLVVRSGLDPGEFVLLEPTSAVPLGRAVRIESDLEPGDPQERPR